MAKPQRFIKPNQVTLNAAGYGYCAVTCPSGVTWDVDITSVSTTITSPTAVQPVVTIYHDTNPNVANFVEYTSSGNRDTSDTKHALLGGESLCAEWAGGTPGSVGTLRIAGYQTQTAV